MSRLREHFNASLHHQQHNHVRRIVNIEEPAVQILVPDIAALPVMRRNRYECEKCTVLN